MDENMEQLLGFGLEMKRLGFLPSWGLRCIGHSYLLPA
jgi:hypothetical protein